MATFNSKLIRKTEIADGTMEFFLEKPAGLEYTPGQHATFKEVNPIAKDDEGIDRIFSFTTIPTDTEIGFATRMRDSAFKNNLKAAPVGYEIEIIDPRGSMVLPKDTSRPLVMLAGGIGITPFISMIKQATEQKSAQKIYFFFSNKTKADAPFFAEIEALKQQNPNFEFIPTMTETDPTWTGETGYITKEMISKYVTSFENTVFYFAGPPSFADAMQKLLDDAGIDPLFIKSEGFDGY